MISLHSERSFLVPVLTSSNVVILDNAKVHYDEDAIAMIEAFVSGVLFLPPYSPELNPIEHIWSKVKSFIKKTVISTTEELYQAITSYRMQLLLMMPKTASSTVFKIVPYAIGKRYSECHGENIHIMGVLPIMPLPIRAR